VLDIRVDQQFRIEDGGISNFQQQKRL